jgi:ferredoxin-type protein NapF
MSPSRDAVARIKSDCLAHRNVFCCTCGEACEPDAIRFAPAIGRAPSPEINADACTGCGECIDICPADAVVLKPRSIKEAL